MSGGSVYTIDRFEGDWGVLEDDQSRTFNIPRRWLPSQAREGDVVKLVHEEREPHVLVIRMELDPAARAERLAETLRLRNQMPQGPKGDISM